MADLAVDLPKDVRDLREILENVMAHVPVRETAYEDSNDVWQCILTTLKEHPCLSVDDEDTDSRLQLWDSCLDLSGFPDAAREDVVSEKMQTRLASPRRAQGGFNRCFIREYLAVPLLAHHDERDVRSN